MKKTWYLIFLSFFISQLLAQNVSFSDDQRERGYYNRPYLRYEAEPGLCQTNGNFLNQTYDQSTLQSEASNQVALQLIEKDDYVEWTLNKPADALTIRFSLPDNNSGVGTKGNFALYINGSYSQSLTLDSYWAWQYFPKVGSMHSDNQPAENKFARMRFDETHLMLKKEIQAGETIRLVKLDDNETPYTIDFIELEKAPVPVTFESITDENKIMYDSSTDLAAFIKTHGGKTIYIPSGKHEVNDRISINKHNTKIIGAGMWYTELYFQVSSDNASTYHKRGIETEYSNILIDGLYLNTVNNKRYYDNNEAYQVGKGFMGGFGTNSIIRNVWVEHFECGAWLSNAKRVGANNLLVEHCRFRNNYADGLNLCSGMKTAVVQYCSFRNNGDDDMASWSVNEMCENNTFQYNTAENNWRASSLGFFGGKQNKAHHCVIIDPMEAGMRVTCDFTGTGFSEDGYSEFSHISLYRSGVASGTPGIGGDLWGNQQGAVQLYSTQQYDLNNFKISDIDIYDSKNNAILIASYRKKFANLVLRNINIDKTGRYGIYYYQPEGHATFCNIVFQNIGEDKDINLTHNSLFSFTEDCTEEPKESPLYALKKKRPSISVNNSTVAISGLQELTTITLYDNMGRTKLRSQSQSNDFVAHGLETGIYFIRLDDKSQSFKIIVQ